MTMMLKHLCLLTLAVVACVVAQNDEFNNIPVENDNQFPPEDHSESEGSIFEGSGSGVLEEPVHATTQPSVPLIEDVQTHVASVDELPPPVDTSCPSKCVCHTEGDSDNFVVDCSGYELTEFPSPIDTKTTTLNIQNNKLTEIPKDISALKNLKVLNANNNSIMDLASGSISELPELKTLKLANNKLIELPKDLKNSFGLTKLEELDLGGNDMRTSLTKESFSGFTALRTLTLPTASSELVNDLCNALKNSLELVCTESCNNKSYECPDAPAPAAAEEDLLVAVLPGLIALSNFGSNNVDTLQSVNTNVDMAPSKEEPHTNDGTTTSKVGLKDNAADINELVRTAVNTAESVGISPMSTIIEASQGVGASNGVKDENASEISVGATTSESKSGGVDKSVIGIIVAGMVLVVAGITIKKNWSSIRNRFSSTPRPANDRTPNTNGTTPEEVPLQDNKSPV